MTTKPSLQKGLRKGLTKEQQASLAAQMLAINFYQRATEYCMLTRLSFRHFLIHVVGYVAHQSLEHLLKGGLAERRYEISAIEKYNHQLPNLLQENAKLRPGSSLLLFGPIITEVDSWYQLRYPMMFDGAYVMTTSIKKPDKQQMSQTITGQPAKNFPMNLEEFDELFKGLSQVFNGGQIGFNVNFKLWQDIYSWENNHKLSESGE